MHRLVLEDREDGPGPPLSERGHARGFLTNADGVSLGPRGPADPRLVRIDTAGEQHLEAGVDARAAERFFTRVLAGGRPS